MHPLRLVFILSAGFAAAIAAAFGALLMRAGVSRTESVVLAIVVFAIFMVPWGVTLAWVLRRAGDLEELSERTRRAAAGSREVSIADRPFHGELDDLARSIDELCGSLVRQRASFDELRAAIDQILGGLGEGLLAVSAQGRVVFANERVSEMFGDPGTLAGKRVIEVVRKHSVVAALDQALHGAASTERVVAGSGGDERQIEIRAFPVNSSEIAAVALFIDITEIERLQKMRRDFLDDFSHEVRTPLAGLRSAAETLEGGRLEPADEEALRHVMLRQLSRIERLVEDLSELNHIESGQVVLDSHAVELAPLLRDLAADFRERTGGSAVIRIDGDASAMADALRLQQIFSNLLDNAWKHGGSDGEILVEIRREQSDAVVRVSDQGRGIPAGEEERIFNRFYRVDKSRSQAVPGLGLGLAIAKHLVLLHGGAIRASNRESGGAILEVRIPAA